MCIRIIGTSNRRYTHNGDVIVVVTYIYIVSNMTLERLKVIRIVIIHTCKELICDNGMII